MIVHVYDEVEDMLEDPKYKNIIEALAAQRASGRMRSSGSVTDAAKRLLNPMGNARDTIFGMLHVLPAVFEAQFNRPPTHEEAISLLRNSKRLAILPSLLGRSQMQAMIVSATKGDGITAPSYGYDYEPDNFSIGRVKNGKTGGILMDYQGGIGSLPVYQYETDYGDGDVYAPRITVDRSKAHRLEDVDIKKETLTCPARKLISAMWDDVVDIADQAKIYDSL